MSLLSSLLMLGCVLFARTLTAGRSQKVCLALQQAPGHLAISCHLTPVGLPAEIKQLEIFWLKLQYLNERPGIPQCWLGITLLRIKSYKVATVFLQANLYLCFVCFLSINISFHLYMPLSKYFLPVQKYFFVSFIFYSKQWVVWPSLTPS